MKHNQHLDDYMYPFDDFTLNDVRAEIISIFIDFKLSKEDQKKIIITMASELFEITENKAISIIKKINRE